MNDLARFYALNRVRQGREQRSVTFHSIPLDVYDDNPERDFVEVVFVFKTLVDGDQNVALALGLGNQLGIREGAPLGFRDGQHFIIGESLAQAWIDALV
jgi:hypothetical protein